MTRLDAAQSEHDDISQLLPWYLNRSLSDGDHAKVKQHLQQCKVCQTDAQLLNEVLETAAPNETPVSSNSDRLDRVFKRIDDYEHEQANKVSPGSGFGGQWMDTIKNIFSSPQQTMTLAFGVFAAVIALQLLLPTTSINQTDQYEVRSSATQEVAPLILKVTLQQQLSMEAAGELVSSTGLEYQWALTDQHHMTFELPADLAADDVMDAINTLQSNENVSLVETVMP